MVSCKRLEFICQAKPKQDVVDDILSFIHIYRRLKCSHAHILYYFYAYVFILVLCVYYELMLVCGYVNEPIYLILHEAGCINKIITRIFRQLSTTKVFRSVKHA